MSNGNLFGWLHSMDDEKNTLQWPIRMKIAIGLAKGLAWLHHCCNFRVAHLNINTKCVLLDQNFEPKLSNFGMATLINPKEINSSRGFVMDIEFWEECFLKEDVFNYGIVLLELITGKVSPSLNISDGSLDKWVNYHSSSNSDRLHDFVDELLIGKGHDNEIFRCLKVASNCIHQSPVQRPSMLDVYTTISTISD
ncbi:hypothetical protein JCGZ_13532 [Jatropha curcas]|uniref:Protein kinase domain-containing protein n=1 Tax=Jatropha curcas TaxID=180498 RepID=A0A067KLK3_JATCU|nr:hypothetical protein JCGZ_13532 [Jatropha curcas]